VEAHPHNRLTTRRPAPSCCVPESGRPFFDRLDLVPNGQHARFRLPENALSFQSFLNQTHPEPFLLGN
jgi:hypothetical protein